MTITSEQLKKAFAPITGITKQDAPVAVDLEKVTSALVTETGEFVKGDDPMAKLDTLVDRVDKIDALLADATEDADGNVLVKADAALATEFAVSKEETPTTKPADADKAAKDKAAKDKADADKDAKTEKAEDLSDDIEWDRDLAPSVGPTGREARMTKGERPVPARKGGRKRVEKMADAREKSMARRDDRQFGVGRTLS